MSDAERPAVPARTRLKLSLVLLLPLAAVVLATLVFYTGVGIPRGTSNKGELVLPPRPIDAIALQAADGSAWQWAEDGGWAMLLADAGDCSGGCRERLDLTRQLRKALGRNADSVQRYLLSTGDAAAAHASLRAEHPDLRVLGASEDALRGLLARPGDPDPLGSGAIYLVDPRGFVMMYYLREHRGRDTLDDLRFLLRHAR